MRYIMLMALAFGLVASLLGCDVDNDDDSNTGQDLCDRCCEQLFKNAKEHADEWCDGFAQSDESILDSCVYHCNDFYDELEEDELEEAHGCFDCLLDLIDQGESPHILGDPGESSECECNNEGVARFYDFSFVWPDESMVTSPDNNGCF